jgi:hypothetical protein
MIDGASPLSIHSTQEAEHLLEEETAEFLRVPLLALFTQGVPGVLLLRRERGRNCQTGNLRPNVFGTVKECLSDTDQQPYPVF